MQPTPPCPSRRRRQTSSPCLAHAAIVASGMAAALLSPAAAMAAAPAGPVPSLEWSLPFVGILLSIAIFPMIASRFWHHRMGLVCALWTLALLVPDAWLIGPLHAAEGLWHAILIEYLPFVTLLLALFTTGGGILVRGGPSGTPAGNTATLALGLVMAGIMGTTGAAMVLIHPLLRANAHRDNKVHIVVFFIILVANAGGATSPLGDPPLYIGFLHGIPFEWPLLNLTVPLLVLAAVLLPAFYLIDRRFNASESPPPPSEKFTLRGAPNLLLIGVIIAMVVLQGVWRPGDINVLGQKIGPERLIAMAVFLAVTALSLAITRRDIRQGNLFDWHPMEEVGKLFLAIFITIGPVLQILDAGHDGPFGFLTTLTEDAHGHPLPIAYFWVTGILSAFLDNAPTYLVFFELAGGEPARLTGDLNRVLQALAAGAVFFGALTYIGNAPNLMIRSIATHRGIRMPGFLGYLAWSCALLIPVFALLSVIFYL